jgi:hypothetical protein
MGTLAPNNVHIRNNHGIPWLFLAAFSNGKKGLRLTRHSSKKAKEAGVVCSLAASEITR